MKHQIRRERGRRLKAARLKACISQQDMARRLGCSRQLVGSLESGGNLSCDQLEVWALSCGCTTDSLLFGTVEDALSGDAIAHQFAKLEPGLRQRLWMLYQVFVRRGAPDGAATHAASSQD